MKIRIILGASLIAIATSSTAYAADAIVSQEPAPIAIAPAFSWGGAYIGGEAGWGWGRSKLENKTNGGSTELKSNGFIGGVYAGYNFDTGSNVILGVEGNFDYNDLKKSRDFITSNNAVQSSAETKLQWSGAVRARAGYAVDRFMPYIAGGVAFGGVKNSLNIGGSSFSNDKVLTGWTAGAGIDYAATDNILLRLEYRYTDFGKKDFDLGDINTRGSFKTNDIRLGVAYKF
ncbi:MULTISPECIES: outer membrane protein [Brucella/Ochrobactrum group]|uniref:outer membrane protein n=1 Tax=Brucella/Ochrobactrum group TaxID=2826938 RepID=UPI000D70886E|nr:MULTISPECIES: outer membrane protein [Brucella/Ochrobactrum group]MCH4541314.1 porin family protein [Ochrobactrum sp. A-1]PWU71488.1 porin family protein [Ochrobactrum sp. POC9]